MKKITTLLLAAAFLLASGMQVSAAANPSGTGQPSASCEDSSMMPAGFGTDGFANAETRYAGSDGTPSAMHAQSSHAVSQYDVACYQVTANAK